jgi:hypothetical protein
LKNDTKAMLVALLMLALVLLAAQYFPQVEAYVDGEPDHYPEAVQ